MSSRESYCFMLATIYLALKLDEVKKTHFLRLITPKRNFFCAALYQHFHPYLTELNQPKVFKSFFLFAQFGIARLF